MRYVRGLRAQIPLWLILPLILALVGVSVGSITLHQQTMRTLVAERDARLVQVAAIRLNNNLRQRVLILETLLAPAASSAAPQQVLDEAGPLLTSFDLGAGFFDRQGQPLALASFSIQGTRRETLELLAAAVQQPGKPVFAMLPAQGLSTTVLVALTSQEPGRVAMGAVSAEALNLPALLRQLKLGPRAVAYLVDTEGRVIYDLDPAQVGRDQRGHAGIAELQRGEAGAAFDDPERGGDEHVIGYAPISLAGWGLAVEEPWADVIVSALQYTLLAPLVVLAAAVVSLAAIFFGLQRVVRPLQTLGQHAIRLAWGDFEAIHAPVGGIHAIQDLQRALEEMSEQIRRYQSGMQDYIAALTQGQEDERQRLARELHDETIQSLVALSQRVKMVELALQEPAQLSEARARLGELSIMVNQTMQEVRHVIRDLRPIYLEELGLVPALEALAQSTQRDGLAVAFEFTGEERRLTRDAELAIFRIAQAALSNVAHHARATEARVQLDFDGRGITLTVEDDGLGFIQPETPRDLATQGKFGLMGMYERATRLGGHLSIRSAPGQGTKVVAFLPG